MTIREIAWLEEIVDKLQHKHNVNVQEVRAILTPAAHYRHIENGFEPGEDVYAAFGKTVAGRYLVVFFILKRGGVALVISGRDMSGKERRYYEKA